MNKKIALFSGIISIILTTCIYLYTTKSPRLQTPITLGCAKTPLAKVEIQGKNYLLEVDSGSKFQIALSKEILRHLEKETQGTLQARDAKGNFYDSPTYLIPKIKIGNRVFNNLIVNESNNSLVVNSILFTNKSSEDVLNNRPGTIGRALLEKMNLIFDFQHSVILECEDIAKLKEAGYRLENCITVPFEIGRTGAIVTITTDLGKTRLSLDTGATLTLIRASLLRNTQPRQNEYGLPYFHSSTFTIGDKSFGSMNLYLHEITPELHEIDGVLGMDFLTNRIIYINYDDKLIYFLENPPQQKGNN